MVQDAADKIVCDNLQTMTALTVHDSADLRTVECAYRPQAIVTGPSARKKVAKLLREVLLRLIAKRPYVHRENLSKTRKVRPKPHKQMAKKPC